MFYPFKHRSWRHQGILSRCGYSYLVWLSILIIRGRYFAERGSFCDWHFLDAPEQNFWFSVGKSEKMKIWRKKNWPKKRIVVCLEVYFVIYILKMPIYSKNHDNIIVSCEENQLILKILEGWANLGEAELLTLRAFLAKCLPLLIWRWKFHFTVP